MTTPHIVLWDVMGTLVHDPFYVEVPAHFSMTLEELIAQKRPGVWEACERGEMSVEDMERDFFADGRRYDIEGLRASLRSAYRLLPGIAALLDRLREAQVAMHVVSNYTPWYSMIEDAVTLSEWMPWSFVSCELGVRKPDAGFYAAVLERLDVRPQSCVFIDDREQNCAGAEVAGMHAIRFDSAVSVQTQLAALGVRG